MLEIIKIKDVDCAQGIKILIKPNQTGKRKVKDAHQGIDHQ